MQCADFQPYQHVHIHHDDLVHQHVTLREELQIVPFAKSPVIIIVMTHHPHRTEASCNQAKTLPDLMQAFKALQMLIMSVLATTVDDKHRNPMWPAMGYPGMQLTA